MISSKKNIITAHVTKSTHFRYKSVSEQLFRLENGVYRRCACIHYEDHEFVSKVVRLAHAV